MKEIVDKKSEGRSENGDMIVRGLLNTCHNAYLCVHRDGCRNDADGGSGSETDACNVGPPDVRRAPVSAPNSPGPALRRSRSPVAGYRTPETRSDERTSGVSMSTSQLFAQVDRLFDGSEADRELASTLLQANEHKLSDNVNFVWRLAKSAYFQAKIEASHSNNEKQKMLVYKSRDLARAALSLDPTSSNAHKWYAITVGSVGEFEGISARIQYGYLFKQHIEKAIQLNPNDATTHYLLGRWCYGVSKLTWVERKVASTLFADPPSASIDDALHHFLEAATFALTLEHPIQNHTEDQHDLMISFIRDARQADRLHSGMFKENLLYLGKCFIEKGDQTAGVRYLQRAARVPVQAADDQEAQKEVEKLLRKYAPNITG